MPRRGLNAQNIRFLIFTTAAITCIQSSGAACPHQRYSIIPNHSACLSMSEDASNSGVSDAQKAEIVDLHNYWRARVSPTAKNMLKMKWDDGVAEVAQASADHCVYGHDTNYARTMPGLYSAGQNIGMLGFIGNSNWTYIITLWHNEVNNFQFGSGSINGKEVLHYTQMVWATTYKIGCGYSFCRNAIMNGHYAQHYVCNYAPAGNLAPDYYTPYRSGTTCEDCPNSCSGNLCDCSSHECYNHGDLNVDTCECACLDNAPFYIGPSCKLNCTAIGTPHCSYQSPDYCVNYYIVPFKCPVMCNWCPEGDSSRYPENGLPPTTPPLLSTVSVGSSSNETTQEGDSGNGTTPATSQPPTNGTTEGAGSRRRGAFLVLNIHLIVILLFLL